MGREAAGAIRCRVGRLPFLIALATRWRFATDGGRSEIRDNNTYEEPHIDGELSVEGETYVIRGVPWVLRLQDVDGMTSTRGARRGGGGVGAGRASGAVSSTGHVPARDRREALAGVVVLAVPF